MPDTASQEWFVAIAPRPSAELELLAFPQAGGGCSAFSAQARGMPEWLELTTLNLPGRRARFGEPPRTDLDELAAELVEYCAKRTRPFLFFGYCSGALLAHAVARGLELQGAVTPRRLVVGSFAAPHLAVSAPLTELDSAAFWKVLIDNHAVSPRVGSHHELRALSEPVIRSDMALVAGYCPAPEPPLKIPIAAIIGDQDHWLAPDDIAGWQQYTTEDFNLSRLPAGHWFIDEDPGSSADALVAQARLARG